jgi:hypothetical protein
MGFEVYRVRNERIKNTPFAVAADIIQKYYEVVDAEDRIAKITDQIFLHHHIHDRILNHMMNYLKLCYCYL